jgi:hypothetical protein
MIAALTLSTLVGNWMCASSHLVNYRFVFSGAGRGSEVQVPPYIETPHHFTYYTESGYLVLRYSKDSSASTVRYVLKIQGNTLVMNTDGYWHDGAWTPFPDPDDYRCKRMGTNFHS